MIDTLIHNAYWLVYVGTILEGETALLLGALTASQGLVDIFWVIAVAFAGATTGDQISYQIFRRFGPAMVSRNETLQRRSEKARRLLADHPIKFIVISRFLWGMRSACMLALAASDVPTRVFAPFNLLACALWASVVGVLGYIFSGWVTEIVSTMDTISGRAPAIFGGIVIFVLAVWLVRRGILKFWRSRDSL
ncbi:MAG: DedA family protein [Anderseniella sp.]|nr:DedA family protein [Anderseniella sp.]